ncbi:MAG TPA: hypothetical protein VMM76_05370, partial [Pirellulaceae bacterium]|nr:hypothetical protein [Pirellulaceae bacterium]
DVSAAGHLHEATILRLCVDKALWQLGWQPCWDVRESLRQTARWYRQYLETGTEMRPFTLSQIEHYETALAAATSRKSSQAAGAPLILSSNPSAIEPILEHEHHEV